MADRRHDTADTIIEGDDTCDLANTTTNLQFTTDPADNPCETFNIAINGGVPPFHVTLVGAYDAQLLRSRFEF